VSMGSTPLIRCYAMTGNSPSVAVFARQLRFQFRSPPGRAMYLSGDAKCLDFVSAGNSSARRVHYSRELPQQTIL
jgi:hypothetical protein